MNRIIGIVTSLFVIVCLAGCDPYERTDVEQSIYVNHQSLSLLVGDQIQLIASPTELTYNWVSEDPSIVTVNSSGLLEAVGEGSTNVVAFHDDAQVKVPVAVSQRISLQSIVLNESIVDLGIGSKSILTPIPVPANANDFNRFFWSSSNDNIVTVNAMGELRAVRLGIAHIIIKGGEISETIVVRVFRSENIALKKPVRVSSVFAPQFVGENAVDGILDTSNNNNRWVSQSTNFGPQWIEVDFEAEHEIHSLQFWTQAGWPCADFRLQKEINGEWVDIFSETGNRSDVYSKTFDATMASKVRLYFTRGSSDGIIRMYEMQVNAKIFK